jgi:hypothetical protein
MAIFKEEIGWIKLRAETKGLTPLLELLVLFDLAFV